MVRRPQPDDKQTVKAKAARSEATHGEATLQEVTPPEDTRPEAADTDGIFVEGERQVLQREVKKMPKFTTIQARVSESEKEVARRFVKRLMLTSEGDLIRLLMRALDRNGYAKTIEFLYQPDAEECADVPADGERQL